MSSSFSLAARPSTSFSNFRFLAALARRPARSAKCSVGLELRQRLADRSLDRRGGVPCPRREGQDDPPQTQLQLLDVARGFELLLRPQHLQLRHIAEVHREEALWLLGLLGLTLRPSRTSNDLLFLFRFRVVIALLFGNRGQLDLKILLREPQPPPSRWAPARQVDRRLPPRTTASPIGGSGSPRSMPTSLAGRGNVQGSSAMVRPWRRPGLTRLISVCRPLPASCFHLLLLYGPLLTSR